MDCPSEYREWNNLSHHSDQRQVLYRRALVDEFSSGPNYYGDQRKGAECHACKSLFVLIKETAGNLDKEK